MSGDNGALVKNAADKRQVDAAGRAQKRREADELADLRVMLSTPEGRRVAWRVLAYCKTFSDIWDASSRIHFNAGQQNVGHWLLAEINAADEEKFFEMMRENKAREKREQEVAEALRAAREKSTSEGVD